MFGKKKQNEKKESLNFKSDNYKMNDNYVTILTKLFNFMNYNKTKIYI